MKRTLALVMAVLLTVSLAGCKKSTSYKNDDSVSRRGPSFSSADETVSDDESDVESESLFASQASSESSEEESGTSSEDTESEAEVSSTASKADTKKLNADDESLVPKSVKDPKSVKMSENLFDFTVDVGGKVYQLPLTVNDFMADGWTYIIDEDEEAALTANSYLLLGCDFVNKDGKMVRVEVVNYANRKMAVENCYITGFSYPSYGTEEDREAVKFAKGIEMQKSKADDVKAAYGDPTTYETNSNGSTYNYKFEDNYYRSYTFKFDADGVMIGFDVTNRVDEPDNYVEPPVSTVAPDYIDDYEAPKELGSELVSGRIQVDKVIYQLPCPLKAFTDDGWEVDDKDGEYASIASNGYESLYLTKRDYEIEVKVVNKTDLALPIEYGQVTYVYAYTSRVEGIELALPGGISMKSKISDLESSGMKDEKNNGTYQAYKDNREDDYEHYVNIYVDKDKDKVNSIVLNYGVDED